MKYYTKKYVNQKSALSGGDMFFLQCKNGCCVVHDPNNMIGCTKVLPGAKGRYSAPNGWVCPFCEITEVIPLRYSTIGHFIRTLDKERKVFDAQFLAGNSSAAADGDEKKWHSIFDGEAFEHLKQELAAEGAPAEH